MLRIIADVHGKIAEYQAIATQAEYSIQLGDMGFAEDYNLITLDSQHHKFFKGNHDDYWISQIPQDLGNFGPINLGGVNGFFVRGGASIDKQNRTLGLDWWPEEQLSAKQMNECIVLYEKTKPPVVFSHECPSSILPLLHHRVFPPSATAELLQCLRSIHEPHLWFFAHHHMDVCIMPMDGFCTFYCLNELSTIDLEFQDGEYSCYKIHKILH